MTRKRYLTLVTAVLLLILLAGCGSEEPTPTSIPPSPTAPEAVSTEPETGLATVESIQILTLETFPVQINVRVRGILPDGCTEIDDITTEQSGNTFTITITTLQETGVECTEAIVPFEEVVFLDVLGLPAGAYTVTVNDISGSFTLDVDNVAQAEPTAPPAATPTPTDSNNAAINGVLWHDLCAVAPAEGDEEEPTPSEGCIATADGDAFQANGLLEEGEPGIENVVVDLGPGPCPATGLETTTTDASGNFSFTGLRAGAYCVSIDPLTDTNTDLLLPGSWTAPDTGVNELTVNLEAGQIESGANFGWDYEFLPIADVDQATCTRSIEFVEDLSIPDDTVFTPGTEFTKSWRLRNNGTCPWIEGYSVVFVGGDQMGAPDSIPLPEVVAPGQTIDLSVDMVAPEQFGSYRSNWQIADAEGEPFGINGLIEEAFYVLIEVGEAPATPEPNSAVIGGVVWADSCFILEDGSPSRGCVETEAGSGFYIADGSLNFNEAVLPDVTVSLSAGACPEGNIPAESVLATAVTDEDGLYRFRNLEEGVYCVFIDAFSDANVDLLIPGDWTWPAPGVGRVGQLIDPGEERLTVDFGWDYDD